MQGLSVWTFRGVYLFWSWIATLASICRLYKLSILTLLLEISEKLATCLWMRGALFIGKLVTNLVLCNESNHWNGEEANGYEGFGRRVQFSPLPSPWFASYGVGVGGTRPMAYNVNEGMSDSHFGTPPILSTFFAHLGPFCPLFTLEHTNTPTHILHIKSYNPCTLIYFK